MPKRIMTQQEDAVSEVEQHARYIETHVLSLQANIKNLLRALKLARKLAKQSDNRTGSLKPSAKRRKGK